MKIKPTHQKGRVVLELGANENQLPGSKPNPVFRLNKIMVPVDFSDCSFKALQYAVPMARQFKASILLVHVIQPYVPAPELTAIDLDLLNARVREGATEQLTELKKSVPADVPTETELRIGNSQLEIVDAAKTAGVDLIILSTHGRTGLAHVFMGSTTERVIRHAGCPVLVVREHEHEFVTDLESEAVAAK